MDSVPRACRPPKLDDLTDKFSPSLSCGHVRYLLHHLQSGLQRLAEEPHPDLHRIQLGLLNWSLVHVNEVALEPQGGWLPFTSGETLARAPTAGTFATRKGLGVPEDSGQDEVRGRESRRSGTGRPGVRRAGVGGRIPQTDGDPPRRGRARAGSGPRRGRRRASRRPEPRRQPAGGPGSAARPPTCARIQTASDSPPPPRELSWRRRREAGSAGAGGRGPGAEPRAERPEAAGLGRTHHVVYVEHH